MHAKYAKSSALNIETRLMNKCMNLELEVYEFLLVHAVAQYAYA